MEVVKFADIVSRVNTKEDRFNTDKIYYVGGDHIDSNELMVRQRGIIKGSTIGPMFYCGFKAGDILFVTRNPHLRKCAVVDIDGICSEKTFVLATKDSSKLLQEYLALIMQSDEFWAYCDENKSGGVNFFLNWSTLADYEFSLPSIEEQKVLADKLWAAYKVKESYRQLLSTTDEMLKAKFQEMFDFQDLDLTNPTNDFDKYCFDATSSATKIPAGNYLDEGKYAIYDQGQEKDIAGFTNTEDGVNKDYPVILFGDHSRVIKFINEPFFIGADGVKIIRVKDEKTLLPYFLFYDLLYHNIPNTGYNRHFKYIKMLKLTVPPMELQQQFAEIATQAEATKTSLRASIEAIDRVIRSLINQ